MFQEFNLDKKYVNIVFFCLFLTDLALLPLRENTRSNLEKALPTNSKNHEKSIKIGLVLGVPETLLYARRYFIH